MHDHLHVPLSSTDLQTGKTEREQARNFRSGRVTGLWHARNCLKSRKARRLTESTRRILAKGSIAVRSARQVEARPRGTRSRRGRLVRPTIKLVSSLQEKVYTHTHICLCILAYTFSLSLSLSLSLSKLVRRGNERHDKIHV